MSNKSLREEIYYLIRKARSWEEIERKDSDYYTDEILKLIEKRIDSRYKELEDGRKDYRFQKALGEEKWNHYLKMLQYFQDELERVKELLK